MPTDIEPGWTKRKRSTYNDQSEDLNANPMPGVVWLSDLLKVVDAKRQTGFNDDDLPAPLKAAKSFIDVPHDVLGKDGYPSSMNWLDLACQKYIRKKAKPRGTGSRTKDETKAQPSGSSLYCINIASPVRVSSAGSTERGSQDDLTQTSIQRVPMSLPSLYDVEQGLEMDSITVPIPGKKRRAGKTRHPAKAAKALAGRRAEVSSACQQAKPGRPFYREYPRFNDPVLPIHDYDRTMEIVSKLYHVIDHGHGQLVDMETKKLICTYAFEDLETMDEQKRNEHQSNVQTVMMATDLFRKMPINQRSNLLFETNRATQIAPIRSPVCNTRAKARNQVLEFPPQPQLLSDSRSSNYPKKTCCTTTPSPDQGPSELIPAQGADIDTNSSPLTSLAPSEINKDDDTDILTQRDLSCEALKKELNLLMNHPTRLQSSTRESSPLTSLAPSVAPDSSPQKEFFSNDQAKTQITTNGALINGKMFCFGARAGYDPEILFSPYIPRHGASLSLYKLFLSQLPIFGSHLGAFFEAFADEAFLTARRLLNILNAPSMVSTDKNDPLGRFDFAGNFAFTFHNFFNKPHTDNDKGNVYCVWYPMESASRRIVTTSEGFRLEGGFFLFPEYRLAFNFGGKYVVQITWSGKHTFHQTLPSKEEDVVGESGEKIHFTRLGCSSQLTSSMARAAAKLGTEEQYNFSSDCERHIIDCKDILKMKGRGWKN
ncbi:hypothetical protein DFH28DRAFT_1181149 [Melampsora americana]|nr:hypothetical protein DFH28DRAFT_1181149 [Melampsora americana]